METMENSALLLVDLQNDFCPGGALAVPEGDRVAVVANRISDLFGFVVASQDWHPPNHVSFRDRGGPWPPHCIQGSSGADLHPALDQSRIDLVVRKGSNPDRDAYSAFEAMDETGRTLDEILKNRKIDTLFIAGLATDYCVRASALDGITNGYRVYIVRDAVGAVEVNHGDGDQALEEIVRRGGRIVAGEDLPRLGKE